MNNIDTILGGPENMMGDTDLVDQLTKALTAGFGYEGAPGALTGGGALQVESLDNTLKSVTWSYQHLRIWPIIPKDKAFNTVEQFNRQTSYGSQQDGGFFDADSGLTTPQSQDATFNRDFEKIRYIGTTRSVTHPMTLVKTAHAPAVALQIKAGTQWILEQMERQLFTANGYFINAASGNYYGNDVPTASIKFNGIDQQIRRALNTTVVAPSTLSEAQKNTYTGFEGYGATITPVKDVRGVVPDEDDITDWAYTQAANFGVPNIAFFPLKALADISRTMLPKERVVPPGQEGRGGFVMTEFIAGSGVFKMVGSRFLDPKRAPMRAGYSNAAVTLAVPSIVSSGAVADGTSQLTAGTTYYYVAAACDQFGETTATLPAGEASQLVAANQGVTLSIAHPGAGDIPTHYAIYRSTHSGIAPLSPEYEFIGFVAKAAGANPTVFRDVGRMLPGLGHAYLMQFDADSLVWKQLAPLMKMDLAIVTPAYRWMQLLYGAPILFASLHHAIMDNIGRAS